MASTEDSQCYPYSSQGLSGRERAKSERTLVCLLRACQGHRTTIELRNETVVTGEILNCDGFMNITVKDAITTKISGQKQEFSIMHIIGSNIRYVHIPDEINIQEALVGELSKITKSRQTGSQFGRMSGKRPRRKLQDIVK